MVTLTLILGVALLGTAFALLVRATLGARARALTTVKQIDEYGFGTAQAAVPATTSWPLVDRLATSLGNRVARRLGGIREAEIRRELVAAGIYRTSPRKFMGYRALTAGGIPVVWLLL